MIDEPHARPDQHLEDNDSDYEPDDDKTDNYSSDYESQYNYNPKLIILWSEQQYTTAGRGRKYG